MARPIAVRAKLAYMRTRLALVKMKLRFLRRLVELLLWIIRQGILRGVFRTREQNLQVTGLILQLRGLHEAAGRVIDPPKAAKGRAPIRAPRG